MIDNGWDEKYIYGYINSTQKEVSNVKISGSIKFLLSYESIIIRIAVPHITHFAIRRNPQIYCIQPFRGGR